MAGDGDGMSETKLCPCCGDKIKLVQLKICPFCGSAAELRGEKREYFVGCSNEECVVHDGLRWKYEMASHAIAEWNYRPAEMEAE